jgi:hypothetical protein
MLPARCTMIAWQSVGAMGLTGARHAALLIKEPPEVGIGLAHDHDQRSEGLAWKVLGVS